MPEHRNYDAYTMAECWEAVLGGPLGYGKDDGFNLEKAVDKSKVDPFTLFDLGSKLYTLGNQLNTLRTNVYDLFNSLVGVSGDLTNVSWQGPAADTFRRIGFGIIDYIDKNLKAIWWATYRYDSLVTDSGTNLQAARNIVYSVYMEKKYWAFKFEAADALFIPYAFWDRLTAKEILFYLGVPNRALYEKAGLVYYQSDYDRLKTGDWFPMWTVMETDARPAVKELANRYTIRSSQFESLPTEPDYENAPPPPKTVLAVLPKDKDEDKDKDDNTLKIDFDPPKFDFDKKGLDDLKGSPDLNDLNGPPDPNGLLNGPPGLNNLNQKPPGDLPGVKKVPGGFDINGDGKPDLDANGNPLAQGLGKKVPGGFDIDGDGKADLDANGNPLPNNTKLNRLQPPGSNLKSPGGDLKPPGLDLKPPGTDLFPPKLRNLKDPFGDGGGSNLPPPPLVPPPGGLNNRLPKFGGSGGGLGLGNDLKGPAGNSLGQSGVKGGAGGRGVGAPLGGGGLLGRQGLGGMGGGYPPPMHPHGAGGKKENEERERQTWLMEDDEVWADSEEVAGVLGRPTDEEAGLGAS